MQALIVNSDSSFNSQLQEEAGAKALITPSYVQGLRYIADQSLPLAGIYLNPSDSSYSALRFLAIAMMERPVTPIFILDGEGDLTAQNFSCLADKFKIQGAFKGRKNFQELLKPLRLQIPPELQSMKTRAFSPSRFKGYVSIPVIDFIHNKQYPYNAFVEDENQSLRFFAMEGSEVDLEYLIYLSKSTSVLYVEESSVQSRKISSKLIESSYLDPDYLSPSWRNAETLYRAKAILSDLKKGAVSEELVTKTFAMIESIVKLVSQFSQEQQLKNFVAQAKECDRTIACLTYSVLLCKELKFEKHSLIESLGLASFFQDISLYQSPEGDISGIPSHELSDSMQAYYLEHPQRSADLILKVGTIPELAVQVVRQQHERGDRTGFPARVGGAQLQPLAEILSLINAYLDDQSGKEPNPSFLDHYSEPIVAAFRRLNL